MATTKKTISITSAPKSAKAPKAAPTAPAPAGKLVSASKIVF